METKKLVKSLAKFGSGMGTAVVVENIVSATLPSGAGFVIKALSSIGEVAISLMAADHVSEYTSKRIDDMFDQIENEEEVKEPKVETV